MDIELEKRLQRMETELRALRAQAQPQVERPWRATPARVFPVNGKGSIIPSVFDIMERLVDGNPAKIKVRGGNLRFLGLSKVIIADTTIEVSGTNAAPCVIAISYNTVTNAATIVALPDEESSADSGSVWFRPLFKAYLLDGTAVIALDRRLEWLLGSPIR